MWVHLWRSENDLRELVCFCTVWVPGIALRSLGLWPTAFTCTAISLALVWSFNECLEPVLITNTQFPGVWDNRVFFSFLLLYFFHLKEEMLIRVLLTSHIISLKKIFTDMLYFFQLYCDVTWKDITVHIQYENCNTTIYFYDLEPWLVSLFSSP